MIYQFLSASASAAGAGAGSSSAGTSSAAASSTGAASIGVSSAAVSGAAVSGAVACSSGAVSKAEPSPGVSPIADGSAVTALSCPSAPSSGHFTSPAIAYFPVPPSVLSILPMIPPTAQSQT